MTIRDSKGAWPFVQRDAFPLGDSGFEAYVRVRDAHGRQWTEVSEDVYQSSLDVLPPIYFPGGFFVGEAANSDERGVPTYHAFVKRGGRFFLRECAVDKHAEALAELADELRREGQASNG